MTVSDKESWTHRSRTLHHFYLFLTKSYWLDKTLTSFMINDLLRLHVDEDKIITICKLSIDLGKSVIDN